MANYNEKVIKDKDGGLVNNYIILSGRLGKDFESFSGGEKASMAFYVGKEKEDEWIEIKTFTTGITSGFKKGDAVQIKGRYTQSTYKDKDGVKRTKPAIIFDRIEKIFAE